MDSKRRFVLRGKQMVEPPKAVEKKLVVTKLKERKPNSGVYYFDPEGVTRALTEREEQTDRPDEGGGFEEFARARYMAREFPLLYVNVWPRLNSEERSALVRTLRDLRSQQHRSGQYVRDTNTLLDAFMWSRSGYGYNYWSDISERLGE